jgi:predicted dehydrogenase
MNKIYQSRRDFLKKLAITGSVASLAASPWLKAFTDNGTAAKGPNETVRLAIIGTGSRGNQLLRLLYTFAAEANVTVSSLCDNYAPHLEEALSICTENGVNPKTYLDYRDVIDKDKPDAVIIATPLHQHAHIAIDCFESGLHVFCEKSMARTLEDTKAIYDAHKAANRVLVIGHQRLCNPVYLEGMQRIHNGDLGVIGQIRAYWHRNNDWRRPLPNNDPAFERQINWRLYKEYSAGLLTELMSHQIQVANWALQKTPVSVMGTSSIRFWKDGREVPDNVALIFSYDDGTKCIYDSMISNKKYGLEEQIMGHLGTIEFEVNKQYSELDQSKKAPGIQQMLNDIENSVFDKLPIGGASWAPEIAVTDQGEKIITNDSFDDTALLLEAFVKYVREGSAPEKLTTEGYNASTWTLLAEKALYSDTELSMPSEFII